MLQYQVRRMRMMRGRALVFAPRIQRLHSLLGLRRSNSHEYLPVTPWSFQGCTQLRFSSSATPQPPYAAHVPVESIPISDALKQCRPNDAQKWASDLKIISGNIRINNIGEWAALPERSKEKLEDSGLPRVVIQALDAWFLEQLGRFDLKPLQRFRELQARPLVGRGEAEREVKRYIAACVAGPPMNGQSNEVWSAGSSNEWKCQLLCTSGVMGIGKSAVLSHVSLWADSLAREGGFMTGAKVIHISFNGGAPTFVPDRAREGVVFGHHMLRCVQYPERWLSKITSLSQSVSIVRDELEMDPRAPLIVTVDEIVHLESVSKGVNDGAVGNTVAAAMQLQDKSLRDTESPTLFIFSSILEMYFPVMERRTGSGRSVKAIPLSHLPLRDAHEHLYGLRPGLREAAEQHPALRQLILSCMGHPRALFEGIVNKVPLERLNTCSMAVLRDEILTMCKLDALRSRGDVVRGWFNDACADRDLNDLKISGVLHSAGGQQFILPIMLHGWAVDTVATAGRSSTQWQIAYHLQEAFDADAVLEADYEKGMEYVIVHYEAVRRICRAGRTSRESIGSFFGTKWIGDAWKARPITIRIPPASSTGIIQYVADFSDADAVLKMLHEGFIVVSEKRTEHGIEYVAPFFEPATGALLVECAQCKFVAGTVDWAQSRKKFDSEFTESLVKKKVEWFPVMYTNHHAALAQKTYVDGVYFDELTLFEFTQPLGILRMHLEKLGGMLATKYPALFGPSTKVPASV